MYVSRDNLDWVFSLKIGAALRGFTFNVTLKVNNNLRDFLEPSTRLINKESGQVEFSSVPTKRQFFSRRQSIEEAVEKLNKILTDFYINGSYFLYDKIGFIDQTFITALNKKISIYGSISYFNKKTINDITKIINLEEFLKLFVKKDTLKDSINFQLTNINGQIPQLRGSKIYNFSLSKIGKKRKRQMQEPAESVIICAQQILTLMVG